MTITRNNRYQEGSIQRVVRAKGPDVWAFRWREELPAGRRVQRKKNVGNVKDYPTLSCVKQAVENLRFRNQFRTGPHRQDDGRRCLGGTSRRTNFTMRSLIDLQQPLIFTSTTSVSTSFPDGEVSSSTT